MKTIFLELRTEGRICRKSRVSCTEITGILRHGDQLPGWPGHTILAVVSRIPPTGRCVEPIPTAPTNIIALTIHLRVIILAHFIMVCEPGPWHQFLD